jgi:pyrroloquinoline quinone (PQQ) biosynthesis protein C
MTKQSLAVTPHPEWVIRFLDTFTAARQRLLDGRFLCELREGRLSLQRGQRALLGFYPLVLQFPQLMAQSLAKVPADGSERSDRARHWLITNIAVERRHGQWWRDWAQGFGVPVERLQQEATVCAEVDAINHYLWRVCDRGDLAQGIAAANFAVEGVTGEWTRLVWAGFREHYRDLGATDRRSLAWLEAHARYDDAHPHEALEIVKAFATTEELQVRAAAAAVRAVDYLILAFDAIYDRDDAA